MGFFFFKSMSDNGDKLEEQNNSTTVKTYCTRLFGNVISYHMFSNPTLDKQCKIIANIKVGPNIFDIPHFNILCFPHLH